MRSNAYTRNTTPGALPLVRGVGAQVFDSSGRRFIDCCSQTLNNNLGQCHPIIQTAVQDQMSRLTYASSRFSSDVSESLHDKLVEITPKHLTRVNLSSVTGSLANECAIKAARKKSERELVVSFERAHLGQSTETMRLSGKHSESKILGERKRRLLPAPYCFRCPVQKEPGSCHAECLDGLEAIEREDRGDVAAIIVEPVMVDAGVLTPPARFHERLRGFATANDVCLIWDEIQTAFGWLGTLFAMEVYKILPDILTLAKGLGAGFPIAATVVSDAYDVLEYGEHEFTAGAHPISCAASLAMIDHLLVSDELKRTVAKGEIVRTRLARLAEQVPAIGDVRGIGLLVGIEIVDPRTGEPDSTAAREVVAELLDLGVITRLSRVGTSSNVVQFKPPLVITDDELEEALEKIEGAFLRRSRRAILPR